MAEQFVQVVAETEGSQREEYFYSLRYQAGTWKRGTMENFINEAKSGFFFDKTDSFHYLENAVRMMVSWLSYHINNFMRVSVHGKGKRPTDTDYPSSFFQGCWETDSQRKTHDAKT